MGCFQSLGTLEDSIKIAEKSLGFEDCSCEEINNVIRKYSFKLKINQSQLERINTQLELRIFPLTYFTQCFLGSLRKSDNTFCLKELQVLGIMLGSGTKEEKARLIYQVFDDLLSNSIENTRIAGEILVTMCKISTQAIPNLIKIEKDYLLTMADKQASIIKDISKQFPKNLSSYSENDFVYYITTIQEGALLKPTGWRNYSKLISI